MHTESLIMSTIQDNNKQQWLLTHRDKKSLLTRNAYKTDHMTKSHDHVTWYTTWPCHMIHSHHMIYHMTMSYDYIHITRYTTWPCHMTTSHDHITLKDHINNDSQHTSARARCLYVTCSFVLFTSSTMTISLSRTI